MTSHPAVDEREPGLSGPLAIMVLDVAESGKLIKRDMEEYVRRWEAFVGEGARPHLSDSRCLRTKSLGDGLRLLMHEPADALAAAADFLHYWDRDNLKEGSTLPFALRIGLHVDRVMLGSIDFHAPGVNHCTHLLGTIQPQEIVATADFVDRVSPVFDFDIEDLGYCNLKHADELVRAFRLRPLDRPRVAPVLNPDHTPLEPVIAVIPFSSRGGEPEPHVIGEFLADGVIARLSRSRQLRVVSRLSSSAFKDRAANLGETGARLGADYILSGSYHVAIRAGTSLDASRITVNWELGEARTGTALWGGELASTLADLYSPDCEIAGGVAAEAHRHICDHEAGRTRHWPIPNLESYSLMIGGIWRMHRATGAEFQETRQLFEAIVARHARISTPRAWLAQWYVLSATRGMSIDRDHDARTALDITRRALDANPDDALARATQGFVHCHLLKDLPAAQACCDAALTSNSNESLAWLYSGVIHAFEGRGREAVAATAEAMRLSPLDPQRYYFESLAATAAVSAHDYAQAEALARSSIRLNRMHSSTWRMLTVALVHQGKMVEARKALGELLRLEPDLTASRYLARMPNGELETGREWARAMKEAGLPH